MQNIQKFKRFLNSHINENTISTQLKELQRVGVEIKHQKIIDIFNPQNSYDIYFGKNRESNHFLTERFCGLRANPVGGVHPSVQDIWLHAAGFPGSHVLVKALKDDIIPQNVIEEAAKIAKKNSKAKNETSAPIVWCYSKNVSTKPSQEILRKIEELEKKTDMTKEEKEFIESNSPAVGRAFIENINRNIIEI
jgi:predicted ribosome quality control (RQC) complex YloA/Tae2 family protein